MVIGSVKGAVKEFFQFKASGGILLIIATVLAMLVENSPLRGTYDLLLSVPVEIRIGEFDQL